MLPPTERLLSSIKTADAAGLECASREVRALAQDAIGQLPAEALTRMIAALNDALTRRVIELASAGARIDAALWCWIALGSEGRQEQTLASDQDNGIIFADSDCDDAMREQLLPLALRINQALAVCGFPLCAGQIMASNPQCCLSLHEWRSRFALWMMEGDQQALLNATIFFDLRALYGAQDLAQQLAGWLAARAPDHPGFLLQMTANALRRRAPLGIWRDFTLEQEGEFAGTIDLKTNAATLFADAARIYGLACGSRVSNTADRLRAATAAQRLDRAEVDAWIEAFYLIQMLRLKHQSQAYRRGAAMHNHVDPRQLEPAMRRALRDALRQARALQKRLALDFAGGVGV